MNHNKRRRQKLKAMVIVNPASGRGRGERYGKKIANLKEEFIQEGIEFNIVFTSLVTQNMIVNLAKEAIKKNYQRVIVVGGDGTINEVVNSIGGSDVSLGVIPAGSANDFSKALRIPRALKEALNVALFGKLIYVDLGKVNEKFFVNGVSFGFDAQIARSLIFLKRKYRFLPGEFAYSLVFLRTLFSGFEYPKIKLSFLEEEGTINIEKITTILAIVNNPYYGDIFRIVSEVSLTDGFLDLCWIEKMKKTEILLRFNKPLLGVDSKFPKVNILRLSSLKITSPINLICQVDGEIFGPKKEYYISIIPNALKVIVPKFYDGASEI